jgi:hypothetical protein
MIDTPLRFMHPDAHRSDVELARDEPSHIHIERPSRRLRQNDATANLELTSTEPRTITPAAAQAA